MQTSESRKRDFSSARESSIGLDAKTDRLIAKYKEIDNLLRTNMKNEPKVDELRAALAFMVRGTAINIHNKFHDIENSMKIITALKESAIDSPTLNAKLNEDWFALQRNLVNSLVNPGRNTNYSANSSRLTGNSTNGHSSAKIVPYVIGIIVFAFILIFAANSCNSSSSYHSSSYTATTPKPTSTPRPTYTPRPVSEPVSGYVFSRIPSDTSSEITVKNDSSEAYYLKFEDSSGKKQVTFYVRAHSTVTVPPPWGKGDRFTFPARWEGVSACTDERGPCTGAV